MTLDVPLVLSILGFLTGSISLSHQIYRYWDERRARPKIDVGISSFADRKGSERTGLSISVTNMGRSTLLLDGVGIYGAACSDDPCLAATNSMRQRLELKSVLKKHGTTQASRNHVSIGDPIRIESHDARNFNIPCNISKLAGVSGEYWGISVRARNGKEWKFDGDLVMQRCRRMPGILRRLLPRKLCLRSDYIRRGWPDCPNKTLIQSELVHLHPTTDTNEVS